MKYGYLIYGAMASLLITTSHAATPMNAATPTPNATLPSANATEPTTNTAEPTTSTATPTTKAAEPTNTTAATSNATTSTPKEGNAMSNAPTQNKGETFLMQNKNQPGVITLPDGLQYRVLKEGQGPKPSGNDIVRVNYAGTLVDGTEFDSSYKRGQPATFPVNGVIAGWSEALKMMNTGSTWMLYIPSSLAYGEQGVPPVIGPNETLIFKVELLGIEK